ncbi:antibiotic biosynthesis monooxygenase [Sphingomonas sp. MAH-20]|uniref:Antibiotic biosynthesis monooxygenase n=1 Tax=Sphingomonas horti TaxID=2682842 RepID=A0A6I4IY74_9SPHN|nr:MULTISPECIES: antibiotic biosynthesis monooxygenase [Sphingomonas]MBA2918203.1 antibiotic biosynthesis monooxygenase [Sphingomonas sp. CGMCC 1.13658]MVO77172.1 antibiotic biosynthesis monooxygenase [Sphingomonas horti]
MIAVMSEGWTAPAHGSEYLDLAARLRPLLDGVPGFISVERFRSLSDPEKLLSLSFWEDEGAVAAWRNRPEHRAGQARGRSGVFRDYRIRIADVSRDYTLRDRAQAPADSDGGRPQA